MLSEGMNQKALSCVEEERQAVETFISSEFLLALLPHWHIKSSFVLPIDWQCSKIYFTCFFVTISISYTLSFSFLLLFSKWSLIFLSVHLIGKWEFGYRVGRSRAPVTVLAFSSVAEAVNHEPSAEGITQIHKVTLEMVLSLMDSWLVVLQMKTFVFLNGWKQ